MRKLMRALWLLGLIAAMGLAGGCDKTGGTDGGVKEGGVSDLPPGAADVVALKKAGDTASADFSKAAEYLIVPYSVSAKAADAIAFTITIKGSAAAGIGEQSYPLTLTSRQRPPLDPDFVARWQRRLSVERWLRGVAEKAAMSRHSLPGKFTQTMAGAACVASKNCDANEVCNNKVCASTLTIKTGKFSSTASITANVKKKGTKAAVLVDSADTVPQGTIDSILDRFEKIILPRDVALFGDPPLQGTSGTTASDRNADGIVWLVLTKKVQEKNAVGFFVATDFTDEALSNKADILYIDSAATTTSAMTIMAHEYQHLLNYGSKVYKPTVNGQQGALEALWLDEGEAHFAEDGCGFGGENTNLLRQEAFPNFSDKSMLSTVDSLALRGMAFLYVRYLFEQKGAVNYDASGIKDTGGAAFLQKLHTTSKQGVEAVNEALAGTFSDWQAGFDNWLAAVSLDGRGIHTDLKRYLYLPLLTDPVTSNQIGVKIRGARNDDSGKPVNLEGPTEDPIADATKPTEGTIPNATGKFFLLKNQTGKVEIKVTSDAEDFRFAVIRLKPL